MSGLQSMQKAILVWWPSKSPAAYRSLEHPPNVRLNLKQIFDEEWREVAWFQLLSIDEDTAPVIRDMFQDIPNLADDPNNDRPQPPPTLPRHVTINDEDDHMSQPDDDMTQPDTELAPSQPLTPRSPVSTARSMSTTRAPTPTPTAVSTRRESLRTPPPVPPPSQPPHTPKREPPPTNESVIQSRPTQ